jgi:hypothetical protein
MDFAEGEARVEVSPFPRELRRRPNFSHASSSSAWPPKNKTLARFTRARRERAKWPAGGRLPPGGAISNTVKWPAGPGRPFGAHIKRALYDSRKLKFGSLAR